MRHNWYPGPTAMLMNPVLPMWTEVAITILACEHYNMCGQNPALSENITRSGSGTTSTHTHTHTHEKRRHTPLSTTNPNC